MQKTKIVQAASELNDRIATWRREFHFFPETGLENPVTAGKIVRILLEIGITEIKSGLGGTGIAAVIEGGAPGRCLGLRADTDALPIAEETGLPFAADNGNMHACGHDAHMAMLLGAAKLIYENRELLRGSVKLIFQPGEETGFGAKRMVEAGVLESPHVDAMIGQHAGCLFEGFSSGQAGYLPERFGFCNTRFEATFRGKAAHAAQQNEAVDAIAMACYAVSQLQVVMAREKNCFEPAIISVGRIEGGIKNNIVADRCYLTGTIRSENPESQHRYESRLKAIFNSVAESMRGTCEVTFPFMLRSTNISPVLLAAWKRSAVDMLGAENVLEIKKASAAGEDFSEFCQDIPGLFWFFCTEPEDGRKFPHHSPQFDIDESQLWKGAALLAQFAFDWEDGNEQ